MKLDEYEQLKQQIEDDFANATRDFRQKREHDLAALERVYEMAQRLNGKNGSGKQESASVERPDSDPASQSRIPKGRLQKALATVIDTLSERFTVNTLKDVLEKEHDVEVRHNSSLANAMKGFVEDGVVVIHEQGAGRRATVYEKKKVKSMFDQATEEEMNTS